MKRLGLVLVVLFAFTASAAGAVSATKVVRYHGIVLRVPAGWPVFSLAADPHRCVRFDRHAVYLGVPGAAQKCPGTAIGRTEAILVAPAARRSARALPQVYGGPVTSTEVNVGGVLVTATWGSQPDVLARALDADPRLRGRVHVGASARAARAPLVPSARAATGPGTGGVGAGGPHAPTSTPYTGLGFDACSAPSSAQMADWSSSPYRAVGIYIGGANMGCGQSNLSSAWTSAEVGAGWHLVPTYVGLQAPGNSCGCAAIQPGQATAEGQAAAQDAMAQAELLGIGPGNPIYDDMEAYSRGGKTTTMVLNFLAAWTQTLHAGGYLSGVYSSSLSGISDLAAQYGTSYAEPDDLWVANWNGLQSTSDPQLPATDWPSHQRMHQYQGGHNETYNAATLNVDSDYLDATTAGAAQPFADGSFVQVPGNIDVFEIAGGAPMLVMDPTVMGGATPTQVTQAEFQALGALPLDGTFLTTAAGAIYRVAGGAALPVSSWTLFGGQQTSVTIDPWDIYNAGNPAAHLNAAPASGTVVQGLPSGRYWQFTSGKIRAVSATPAAIQVDDQALAGFQILAPPPLPPCVVPNLHGLSYRQAIAALRKAHCRLGKVHWPRKRHHRSFFRVLNQRPKAHSKRANGSRVNITLYYA